MDYSWLRFWDYVDDGKVDVVAGRYGKYIVLKVCKERIVEQCVTVHLTHDDLKRLIEKLQTVHEVIE